MKIFMEYILLFVVKLVIPLLKNEHVKYRLLL